MATFVVATAVVATFVMAATAVDGATAAARTDDIVHSIGGRGGHAGCHTGHAGNRGVLHAVLMLRGLTLSLRDAHG